MISAHNRIHSLSNSDLHSAARDYGPEPITARTALDAVNLAEAMAENRSRLTVRAALVAVALNLDTFDHPEHEAEEC